MLYNRNLKDKVTLSFLEAYRSFDAEWLSSETPNSFKCFKLSSQHNDTQQVSNAKYIT